jgi:site-specific recombinase XerD
MAKSTKKRTRKTILKLPDLEQSKSAVLNSLTSPNSRRSYDHAIRDFIDWYCSEPRLALNRTVVTRYRIALKQRRYAPSTINPRLAAVRRMADEAADCGLLSPDLAAGIRRVKGAKRLGVRVGNWLSAEQGRLLLATSAGPDLRTQRNQARLALLIGCGLRRAEIVTLRVEDVQLREDHWIGVLFRSINKVGKVWGNGFTPKVIWSIVKQTAAGCGLTGVAPHDLRRTCARLCHQAGGELEQIQFLLGHVSV